MAHHVYIETGYNEGGYLDVRELRHLNSIGVKPCVFRNKRHLKLVNARWLEAQKKSYDEAMSEYWAEQSAFAQAIAREQQSDQWLDEDLPF